MSDLLAYWRYDNYIKDLAEGAGFNFNSNQQRLHQVLAEGDSLWLVTGQREPGRARLAYYVVARLVVRAKTLNAPGFKYGKYRVWGDFQASHYYRVGVYEASTMLRLLPLKSGGRFKPIADSRAEVAQHLQTVRELSSEATAMLEQWCAELPREDAAYQVLPESILEQAIRKGSEAVERIIREKQPAIAEYRKEYLLERSLRNRALAREIQERYSGRCQICGFDPVLLYGVEVCHAHHLIYLSSDIPFPGWGQFT